jgi:hypothetical protein
VVLQYLRNIAKSANQIELEENIAMLKGSQIWKASVQLQKYFSEFWGLHLQVLQFKLGIGHYLWWQNFCLSNH